MRRGGGVPLPVNKHLRIPVDAYWDWPALQIVLRQIRLHRKLTSAYVAAQLGYKPTRFKDWELYSYEPPDRIKKEWASVLGYKLYVHSWRQPPYRLEKKP